MPPGERPEPGGTVMSGAAVTWVTCYLHTAGQNFLWLPPILKP